MVRTVLQWFSIGRTIAIVVMKFRVSQKNKKNLEDSSLAGCVRRVTGNYLPVHMAYHPRRHASPATPLTESNISQDETKSIICLTLRRLMSYIYMEHPFLMFLDHTQRRSTVGRTPLDE